MNPQREMTLDELMERLPTHHLANRMLADLRARFEAQEKEIERLMQDVDQIRMARNDALRVADEQRARAVSLEQRAERLQAVVEAAKALLKEMYDWTNYKNTSWAKKVKEWLDNTQP